MLPLHSASVLPTPACAPVVRTRVTPAYPATSKLRTHVTLAARPAAERAGSEGAGLAARGTCVRRLAVLPRSGASTPPTPPHPPPTPCGFSTQQTVGGGESSGKRKFCYKVATQREPGGCGQKVFKKNSKKPKKNSKNEKVDKAHRITF